MLKKLVFKKRWSGGVLEKEGVLKNSISKSCQVKFALKSVQNTYKEVQF